VNGCIIHNMHVTITSVLFLCSKNYLCVVFFPTVSSRGRGVRRITCLSQCLLIITVVRLVSKCLCDEALYGTQVYFPHCWDVVGERCLIGSDWVQQTHDKVWKIR